MRASPWPSSPTTQHGRIYTLLMTAWKVALALAAGCTTILKQLELASLAWRDMYRNRTTFRSLEVWALKLVLCYLHIPMWIRSDHILISTFMCRYEDTSDITLLTLQDKIALVINSYFLFTKACNCLHIILMKCLSHEPLTSRLILQSL